MRRILSAVDEKQVAAFKRLRRTCSWCQIPIAEELEPLRWRIDQKAALFCSYCQPLADDEEFLT